MVKYSDPIPTITVPNPTHPHYFRTSLARHVSVTLNLNTGTITERDSSVVITVVHTCHLYVYHTTDIIHKLTPFLLSA